MQFSTHLCRRTLPVLLVIMTLVFSGCSVYTIDKSHLEARLLPSSKAVSNKGLGLNNVLTLYSKEYNNHVDTVLCVDKIGKIKARRLTYGSKLTVITANNKGIRFYAKTLYIWKGEYLIGERTTPSLRGPNCFVVKLKDIARIEVRG